MRFEGTDTYVVTEDLQVAVNAAITLERPLLVKGEPGTGKTVLAHEIAAALGAPLIEWHIKSTTKAQHGLYDYDAVARLRSKRDDVRILVAGSGELGHAVEDRAREARVPVYMLGFQNQSEMPAAYAAADVLVLPSTGRETWGLVANEALACGTPVVLSDAVGAAPDLAGDGVAGRVFPVGDIGALAGAIGEIISAPPSASAIKARSQQYSLSACCEGIEEATRRLCC